jgi:hypothetical protein
MAAVVGVFSFKGKGIIDLSEEGITLSVFDSSSIHAKAEFPKEMFDLIVCPIRTELCIDILAFKECLGLIKSEMETSEIVYSPENPELKIRYLKIMLGSLKRILKPIAHWHYLNLKQPCCSIIL